MNSQNKAQDYVVITHPPGDTDGSQSVEIELYLNATISGTLSLGSANLFELPGLPLRLTANAGINYSLDFRYELAFGYEPFPGNKNGFFIDTSKVLSDFDKTDSGGSCAACEPDVRERFGKLDSGFEHRRQPGCVPGLPDQ